MEVMPTALTPEFQELLSRLEEQRWVNWGLLSPDCPECKAGRLMPPPIRYKGDLQPWRICSNCAKGLQYSLVPLPRPDRRWYVVYESLEAEPEQEERWVRLSAEEVYESIKRERGWT